MPINSIQTAAADPSIRTLFNRCKTIHHLYQIHARIIKKGLEQDQFIVSHLLTHSSSLSYSNSIFNRLISPSTVPYNILLKIYAQKSLFEDTLSLFIRMKQKERSLPDKYTYTAVINACAYDLRLKEGGFFHGEVLKCGFYDDLYVGSSLVDFYGKCKEVVSARKVFDEMPIRNVVSWTALVVGYLNVGDLVNAKMFFDLMPERNLTTWNAMIGGLVKGGDLINARKMFDEMPQRNVVSFTVLIDGYAKSGDMTSAKDLFEKAPEVDIVAWSALISGYAQNGQPDEAVKMFGDMVLKNVKPDEYVMVGLMSACSQIGCLELSEWVEFYLPKSSINIGQNHVISALIDMNAKCGNMDRAKMLFEKMPKRDLITYCSMIQGLSIHGCAEQAVELFNRMINDDKLIPDETAFNVILTACSHGGLVEEGIQFFENIENKYSIVPSADHYACLVDLLGRSGQLRAAYELLNSMPVEPHASAWGALLGACKLYDELELGKVVANRLFELEPQNSGPYTLLSYIHAAADQWLDVAKVGDKRRERGIRKVPGRSWI